MGLSPDNAIMVTNISDITACAHAAGLPMASRPEEVGLSSQRLRRISDELNADAEQGKLPGAVALVARRGKVAYFEAVGVADPDKRTPMRRDHLFRIASMTKPVTAVAALMLMEEGRFALIDPVSRHLPEFENLKVGVEITDPATGGKTLKIESLRRPISVQDLFRHTSGLTYGIFGNSLIHQLYREHKMMDPAQNNAQMVSKLCKLPLAWQPGTMFEYSMATDVLGALVEVLSGMDLNRFFNERIFRPLGMKDTGFLLGEHNRTRLALPNSDPANKVQSSQFVYDPARAPCWYSGGGGLFSTASDYVRFAQMLLNRGELDGVRLLSHKTVQLMTSDHLPPGLGFGTYTLELGAASPLPEYGQGYGLGVGVRNESGRSPVPGTIGDFYWGGAYGTYFWIDPQEQLITILMLQETDMKKRARYRSLMRNLVYPSLID
jgi:CubicO group peptidase (beta-lactamase class C family)